MRVSDSHTDFLTEINTKDERENYVKSIKKVVNIILSAVFTTQSVKSVKEVENYKIEIENFNKKYKTNLKLTIEDLGFVKCKQELKKLVDLKPFCVTLTWNEKNQYAGGANTNQGLTKLGRDTLKCLEDAKILVDTAHLSRKAFWQVAKLSKFPIFNSHSNIFAIHNHKRNLTDRQIKAVVDCDGFLGITLYDKFVAGRKITAKDVANQFDYLIKKFGYKNFGFGTDLFGISKEHLPQNVHSYKELNNVIHELKKLGYSKTILQSLAYKNFENFIKKIQYRANLNKF